MALTSTVLKFNTTLQETKSNKFYKKLINLRVNCL